MSFLSKLTFNDVVRGAERDPKLERREKFIRAVQEQREYLSKAFKGEKLTRTIERRSEDGTVAKIERPVRVWFFQKGNDWYLQPRYGARVLLLDGKSNAIQVGRANELDPILDTLGKAAEAGELDEVLAAVTRRKKKPNAS